MPRSEHLYLEVVIWSRSTESDYLYLKMIIFHLFWYSEGENAFQDLIFFKKSLPLNLFKKLIFLEKW